MDVFRLWLDQARVDLWLCGHVHTGPRDKGYTARRAGTTFLNIASVAHAYNTGACSSFVLEMPPGSRVMEAKFRDHVNAAFVDEFTVRVQFPQAFLPGRKQRITRGG
jgi:hypothetical protein